MSDDQLAAAAQAHAPPPTYDPSAGGSTLQIGPFDTGIKTSEGVERFLAGMGQALNNVGLGIRERAAQARQVLSPKQKTVSMLIDGKEPDWADEVKQDIAQHRQLDQALNDTTAGKVGSAVGAGAALAPAAVMMGPGAGTLLGSTALGAGAGFMQPSLSGKETAMNTGFGAAGGLAGGVASKVVRGLAGLSKPVTPQPEVEIPAFDLGADAEPAAASAAQPAAGGAQPVPPTNGALPVAGQLPDATGANQAQRGLSAWGKANGFTLTPGKESGNIAEQQLEAMLESHPASSGPFNAIREANQTRLNQVVAKAIGAVSNDGRPVSQLDGTVLGQVHDRLGAIYDAAKNLKAGTLDGDAIVNQLAGIEADSSGTFTKPGMQSIIDHPQVAQLYRLAADGQANGAQLRALSSKLGSLVKNEMTSQGGDRALGEALGQVKGIVDDSLADIAGQQGQTRLMDYLRQANGQYRALMQLTGRNSVLNPSNGNVNGRALAAVLQSKDRVGFTFGKNQSDLYQAARFYQAFPDIVGNSGTATRLSGLLDPTAWAGKAAAGLYMNPLTRGAAIGGVTPASKATAALLQGADAPAALMARAAGRSGAPVPPTALARLGAMLAQQAGAREFAPDQQ